jgi:hypothetical protein
MVKESASQKTFLEEKVLISKEKPTGLSYIFKAQESTK